MPASVFSYIVDGVEIPFKKLRPPPDEGVTLSEEQETEPQRSAFVDRFGHEFSLTNEVLVRFKDDVGEAVLDALATEHGLFTVRKKGRVWKLRVSDRDEDAPLMIAQLLAKSPYVLWAEPVVEQAVCPTGPQQAPLFDKQWYLSNTGQSGGTPGADVGAIQAWEITTGSPSISVVVHDSGVDASHPNLAPNVTTGWNFDTDSSNTTPATSSPTTAHGTACAGIVAAAANDTGITGIAPGCTIVPLCATGRHSSEFWAETIDWAADHGQVVSCSWTNSATNILTEAIRRAVNKGVTLLFAVGNNGEDVTGIAYPASLGDVIAVGASTNQDVVAAYSQTGPGLDFLAPSHGGTLKMQTTDIQGNGGFNPRKDEAGNYCEADGPSGFGGTSASTPLVAGVVALMLSVNPSLSPGEVRQILRDTAVKIDPENAKYDENGWSPVYGYGRVHAGAAVRRVMDMKLARSVISGGA
ncbi:MAG: S8 family serine peptidase [Polyangiaceae bacterium]